MEREEELVAAWASLSVLLLLLIPHTILLSLSSLPKRR
jgi:hypothetical protein